MENSGARQQSARSSLSTGGHTLPNWHSETVHHSAKNRSGLCICETVELPRVVQPREDAAERSQPSRDSPKACLRQQDPRVRASPGLRSETGVTRQRCGLVTASGGVFAGGADIHVDELLEELWAECVLNLQEGRVAGIDLNEAEDLAGFGVSECNEENCIFSGTANEQGHRGTARGNKLADSLDEDEDIGILRAWQHADLIAEGVGRLADASRLLAHQGRDGGKLLLDLGDHTANFCVGCATGKRIGGGPDLDAVELELRLDQSLEGGGPVIGFLVHSFGAFHPDPVELGLGRHHAGGVDGELAGDDLALGPERCNRKVHWEGGGSRNA